MLHEVLVIYSDNVNAGYIAKHLIFHTRIKHIEINFHSILKKILFGLLHVEFTPCQ